MFNRAFFWPWSIIGITSLCVDTMVNWSIASAISWFWRRIIADTDDARWAWAVDNLTISFENVFRGQFSTIGEEVRVIK